MCIEEHAQTIFIYLFLCRQSTTKCHYLPNYLVLQEKVSWGSLTTLKYLDPLGGDMRAAHLSPDISQLYMA